MPSASPLASALEAVTPTFNGLVLLPDSAAYEEARRVHNGIIDRRPDVIFQCRGVADVVDAVRFAREHDLEVAIRGGGHNVGGRGVLDGGVMIDLSLMRGMHVDPVARTARVQGGVTWAQFNRDTQVHALATTGGVVGTTGVAGLTLGGGIGYLMGKYGLTVDNLLSVELVTAEGEVLTASAAEHPDLFWACRGGGGNFGVATSFEFRLHPVGPMVTGGLVAHPLSAGRDVMRFFRDLTESLPDEVVAFCGFVHAPDGSGTKLAAIVAAHCGSPAEGEAALRPIKEFGSPVLDAMGPIPYCGLNGMLDAGFPRGALNYWKSSFISELSDDLIDGMLAAFESCPASLSTILLEHIHGAATRVGVSDTAFPHRAPGYNSGVFGVWLDPAQTDAFIRWTRESYQSLAPFMAPKRYVNYLNDDETPDAVAAAYGPNLLRLQQIKKQYDPTNLFHINHNIRPA